MRPKTFTSASSVESTNANSLGKPLNHRNSRNPSFGDFFFNFPPKRPKQKIVLSLNDVFISLIEFTLRHYKLIFLPRRLQEVAVLPPAPPPPPIARSLILQRYKKLFLRFQAPAQRLLLCKFNFLSFKDLKRLRINSSRRIDDNLAEMKGKASVTKHSSRGLTREEGLIVIIRC